MAYSYAKDRFLEKGRKSDKVRNRDWDRFFGGLVCRRKRAQLNERFFELVFWKMSLDIGHKG